MKRLKDFILLLLLLPMVNAAAQDRVQENGKRAYDGFVIPIHGEIDRALTVFLRRNIKQAVQEKVRFIIFDIDTFGGRVDSALQIATLIGAVEGARTIAFVPAAPESTGVSWSAGALIAFSCGSIYMAPATSMGAAAPVYQGAEGMEMAPEKVVSALRTQMAALAEKNGYPKAVALAMVDMDIELLEVFIDGELTIASADDIPELERKAGEEGKKIEKGRIICKSGKLLTLTAGEMEKYGLSSATVSDLTALYQLLQIEEQRVFVAAPSMPDRLVALITGSLVSGLLMIIGLAALYMEVNSPGFGIPGTISIISFAILFISGALLGTVGSLELLLFLAGIILLTVEIFLIPGFGITGISGILLMLISLLYSRIDFVWPEFDWQWELVYEGILFVGLSLLLSLFCIALLSRFLPHLAPFRKLMLAAVQNPGQGFTVQEAGVEAKWLGRRGTAVTVLRPVGKAEIDDQVIVVESQGEYLESGCSIEVVQVDGNRIVVKRC